MLLQRTRKPKIVPIFLRHLEKMMRKSAKNASMDISSTIDLSVQILNTPYKLIFFLLELTEFF